MPEMDGIELCKQLRRMEDDEMSDWDELELEEELAYLRSFIGRIREWCGR